LRNSFLYRGYPGRSDPIYLCFPAYVLGGNSLHNIHVDTEGNVQYRSCRMQPIWKSSRPLDGLKSASTPVNRHVAENLFALLWDAHYCSTKNRRAASGVLFSLLSTPPDLLSQKRNRDRGYRGHRPLRVLGESR
jgi:hypothetical protein